MPTPNVFQFLQRSTTRWRSRGTLQQHMQQEAAVLLLPELLTLPLPVESGLESASLAQILAQQPFVALCGMPGSGRSLALLQLAHQRASASRSGPVLYVPLARAAGESSTPPEGVLAEAAQAAGLPSPLEYPHAAGAGRPFLLLLDEWEALPAARRAVWQEFLLLLPHEQIDMQVVLALPYSSSNDRSPWEGYQMAQLASADELRMQQWLTHLLPRHDPRPLLEALQPGAALAPLRLRLRELLLLAMTYPTSGLPSSRAQLYEWAHEQAHQQPAPPDDGRWSFAIGRAALQHYETASSMAAAGNLNALHHLAADSREDVARLLVSLLHDPSPLYEQLWRSAAETPADLLLLARCVCERPAAAPAWAIRMIEALEDQPASPAQQSALAELGLALPAVLTAAGAEIAEEQASRLLQTFAPTIGSTALLALVFETRLPPGVRWAAGEALLLLPGSHLGHTLAAAQPPDTLAKAIGCSMLALGDAENRSILAAAGGEAWLHALQDGRVSQAQRSRVVNALLQDPHTPAALRSTLLALLPRTPGNQAGKQTLEMLLQMCSDDVAEVRQQALFSLHQRPPAHALRVLQTLLLTPGYAWEVQQDALEQVPHFVQGDASALLARCTLAAHVPMAGRCRALALLANRQKAGAILLRRLLRLPNLHPLIQAGAVRLLMHKGESSALEECCQLARGNGDVLARQQAIEALGVLGQQTSNRAPILESLRVVMTNDPGNTMLTLSAAQALGRLGEAEGVALLRLLLHSDIARSISTFWLACSSHLATTPARDWPRLDLPPAARSRLFSLLTTGQTDADQPGSFAEFIQAQAAEVRMAIASALAELGRRTSPVSQQEIRSTLLACVQQASTLPGHEARHLLDCLARASDDNGLSDLGQMLSNPALDPTLRWLVVEQLSENSDSTPILVRCLEQSILDSFTRSKLAYTLGRQGSLLALPALRRLAEQRDEDTYVRSQAITGLGLLDDSAVETTLLHIVADVTTPPVLRGAAAEALPVMLRADMRHWLYELLHRERQPPELVAGVLHALGRAHDREALSIMLHYAQHEHALVARAALSAIAELEEAQVAPNIIRIAQNNTLDQSVRLHAVGVLLRLCGAEYLPLLRGYLESNVLSLQLQAMDYLMAQRPDDARPLVLVSHKTAPQALRIRAVELLTQRSADHGTLCNLLLDGGDDLHVRLAAAAVLGGSQYAQAIPTLARCAVAPETPLRLRRSCIDALGNQASSTHPGASSARLVLGQLVDDAQQPAENRFWAAAALLHGLC